MNRPDPEEEFLRRHVLQQEAAGPGLKRGERVLVQVERCQHEYAGPVTVLADPPGRLDAVEPGHPDVHHDHVGGSGPQQAHGGRAVAGLPDDVHIRLSVEHHPEPGPHQLLVVDEDNPDAHAAPGCAGAVGSTAVTWNPPPGCGPACTDPPYKAARSRIPVRPWPAPSPGVAPPWPLSMTTMCTASGE